jgi:DUF917 family protein
MKRKLTKDDAIAGVWGGVILGGGGGGHVATALRTASLSMEKGAPELWSVDELPDDALTATVALVGTPSSAGASVSPDDALRSLELLRADTAAGSRLAAVNSNENGAETTINGWLHSAVTGLPVLDLACNGRAHPTTLMGSMGLHLEPGYVSVHGFSGGAGDRHVEGLVRGSLLNASGLVRHASREAGGFVSVSRNPVPIRHARANGAPGAISAAIEVGRRYLDGGLEAVCSHMAAAILAEGPVARFECRQDGGLDVGLVVLGDAPGTTLRFVNEYMLLEQHGTPVASFPDLIMTFADGRPLVSADVAVGADVRVMVAPRSSLLLSPTMHMPDLYAPLQSLLGKPVSPQPLPQMEEHPAVG